ncbi:GNT-I family protein [Cooperia oncophora]
MASIRSRYTILIAITIFVWIYLFTGLTRHEASIAPTDAVEKLSQAAAFLSQQAKQDREELERLKGVVARLSASISVQKAEDRAIPHLATTKRWTEPIAVVVFVCNRPSAVTTLLKRLISRAVAEFGEQVQYVKHKSAQEANVVVPKNHKRFATYYYIARHYKLAFEHVFDTLGHNTAILLEDDLDVSIDFFEYFLATRYLLEKDPTLMCVSAWNDNGKAENIDMEAIALLYRSDFFPGLGWMMTSRLWKELQPKWPNGFWDDWLREPENRKGRQCIRPEISRTGMTPFGKKGASKGLFFDKHLAKVVLNVASVQFTTMNLDYLLNPTYNNTFNHFVYHDTELIVEYTGNIDYIIKADKLLIMHDFKAGVPRTAYEGVVPCYIRGLRIFLVPDRRTVKGYDKTWTVPQAFERKRN